MSATDPSDIIPKHDCHCEPTLRRRGNLKNGGNYHERTSNTGHRCPKEGNRVNILTTKHRGKCPDSAYYRRLVADGSLVVATAGALQGTQAEIQDVLKKKDRRSGLLDPLSKTVPRSFASGIVRFGIPFGIHRLIRRINNNHGFKKHFFRRNSQQYPQAGKVFEFNTELAVRTLPANLQRMLIIAQRLAAGTIARRSSRRGYFSDIEAATYFWRGFHRSPDGQSGDQGQRVSGFDRLRA